MSTATPVGAAPPRETTRSKGNTDDMIRERIAEACSALWWAELIRASLRLVIFLIIAVLVWVVIDQWIYSPGTAIRLLACLGLIGWIAWNLVHRVVPILRSSIRPEYAARSLERDLPSMRQSLTSYLTLREEREQGSLRSRVVRSIGAEAAGKLRAYDQLPEEATGTLHWWVAVALALALFVAYAVMSPKNSLQSAGRLIAPLASIDPAKRVSITDVEPGDREAIAGRNVTVSAMIAGMKEDETATVRWLAGSNNSEANLQYDSQSLRQVGEIALDHSVSGQVPYFIHAGDATAGPFYLSVQDVPVVAVQSVRYQPPAYTGDLPHTSSSGAITAVDGTIVTLRATTNRAVTKAKIEFNPRPLGNTVQATAGATELQIDQDGTVLTVSFPLRSARGRSAAVQLESYRVKVWDAADQSNPQPIIYPIRVIADLPPEVAIVMPRETPKEVPIDAQQVIEVHALDADYGLKRVGLEIRMGIDLIAEPTLWSDPQGASGNRVSEYRFRPSEHGLRVGDRVQIAAIAIDNRFVENDPAIEPNVTATDPIELRIVASTPVPDDPTGADGLSPPDDRPPSDASESSENKDSGEEGESQKSGEGGQSGKQQGGGGSGSGGQSGEAGEESGGGSGEPGEGDQASQNSGSGGDSTTQSPTENQPGEQDQPGEGGSSGGGDATGGQGKGQPNSQPPGAEDPAAEPPAGESQNSDSSDNNSAGTGNNAAESGPENREPQQGADGTASQGDQAASPADGGQSKDGGQSSGQGSKPKGNQEGQGSSSKDGTSAGQEGAGQNGASDGGQRQGESPQHDGEAFERIRDYLEEKEKQRKDSQQASPSAGEEKNDQGSDGRSGAQSSDTGSQQSDTGSQQVDEQKGSQSKSPSGANGDSNSGDQKSATSQDGSKEGPDSKGTAATQQGDGDGSNAKSGDTPASDPNGGAEDGKGDSATGPSADGEKPAAGDSSKSEGNEPSSPEESGTGSAESPAESQAEGGSGDDPKSAAGDPSDQNDAQGGENAAGDSAKGSKPDGSDTDGSKPDGSEPDGSKPDGSKPDGSKPDGSKPDGSKPSGQGSDQANGSRPDGQSSSDRSPQSSDGATGSGAGGDGLATGGDAPTPPDPVDLEYAKQATDMVLDYLDQTRDAPDRDLLKDLNWSEEDLARFAERWRSVREMERSAVDPQANREVEDALKSLGLRQPNLATQNKRESADDLRAIRDSGNRRSVPAAHRDAFEEFRRAVGKQQR